MAWENKAWGRVEHAFHSTEGAVSILETLSGTRCSRHRHRERANMFIVLSGKLVIERIGVVAALTAGESYVVPSGITHQFRVHQGGRVIEVYWPDRGGACRLDDIVRMDEGGDDPEAATDSFWFHARTNWTGMAQQEFVRRG